MYYLLNRTNGRVNVLECIIIMLNTCIIYVYLNIKCYVYMCTQFSLLCVNNIVY